MKKIYIILAVCAATFFSSCDLDLYPDYEITPGDIGGSAEGGLVAMNGIYGLLREPMEYRGTAESGQTFVRNHFQMNEFNGDNTVLSGRTSDPLYEASTYTRNATLKNSTYLWWINYKIIGEANTALQGLSGEKTETAHLRGEAYFMRAYAHLNAVVMWAKPYSHGRDNIGVPLKKEDTQTTTRATVGEIYDLVADDLKEAIRLMDIAPRPIVKDANPAGYASIIAAKALLVRVHLYMGEDQLAINLATEILGDPTTKLATTTDLPQVFSNALDNKETIWAIAHTAKETMERSSIASMYNGDGGWGEVYVSDPLLDLQNRYPQDVRNTFIVPDYKQKGAQPVLYQVRWAKPTGSGTYENEIESGLTLDPVTNKYYFVRNSSNIYVETENVNGFNRNYITISGIKHIARLTPEINERFTYPKYFNTKFSGQGGDPMLSSPIVLRWAEVLLNRAEAYAHKGEIANALADVNIIRQRAGLSGAALFTQANMAPQGYGSVLDVVLDEKRLEFCFEGFRAHDIYRNKMTLNREFPGVHQYEKIAHTDNKIQYFIPLDELLTSGIQQNP